MFNIFFHERAARELHTLTKTLQEQIKKRVFLLKEAPEHGKPLHPSRFWSLRCGDYRVVYEILREKNEVHVLLVGHRKNVYEDFSKLF